MPYLRLTADRRGNEHTFVMHVPAPGEPARILYWYRTAPGIRLGRSALDDGAMRWLEEQYPDIDFDWRELLDSTALTPVEVEAPVPPRKRKHVAAPVEGPDDFASDEVAPARHGAPESPWSVDPIRTDPPDAEGAPGDLGGADMLSDLLGRGIASSVRARHRELAEAVGASTADPGMREGWLSQLAPADPAGWTTPEAVLAGMALFESILDEIWEQVDEAAPPDSVA